MNHKARQLAFTLAALMLAGGTATALWISGIYLTGNLTATTGTYPGMEEYTWDVVISTDDNDTQTFDYFNEDGLMNFACGVDVTQIESTDEACNFEEGEDLFFYVEKDGITIPIDNGLTHTLEFQPGANSFNVITDPHPGRCPLAGQVSMTCAAIS